MTFFTARQQTFYYEDTGGEGPAVVFSHGFLTDHELFAPQIEVLREQYRCVSWDQRYHGQTTADDHPFTISDAVEDLRALLDHLDLRQVVLIGFSFGGWISTRFALAYPERMSALVLIDSYERMESAEERSGYRGFKEMVTQRGFDAEVTKTMRGFLFGEDFDASHWVAKWRFRPPQQWAHVYDAMLARNDIFGRLADIQCPSMVLHSEYNPANPPAVSVALAEALGDCRRMRVIDGSGHTAPLECPKQVNKELTAFLGEALAP